MVYFSTMLCSVADCGRKIYARRLCNRHYLRRLRHGSTERKPPGHQGRWTIHGAARRGHPIAEYNAWRGMKARCYYLGATGYANYGGRGITVCRRWLASFQNFSEDMGSRPSPKHTLDRINNDGNYEPENCRWATRTEQNRNKRFNPVSLANLKYHH